MKFEVNSTVKYAVIGYPVKHSLSPQMQNAAFEKAGLGNPYGKIEVKAEDLEAFCGFARDNLKGFNVTVPHKNNIIQYLDSISDECKVSGSVNTVVNDNGRLYGYSTDGYGLAAAIKKEFGVVIHNNKFCFIGCGGAVKATSFYFAEQEASELIFFNRTVSKAEALAAEITKFFPDCQCKAYSIDNEELMKSNFRDCSVIIQGTSLGLKDDDPAPVNPDFLPADKCFYDTIYRNTKLIAAAKAKGMKTADGRTMLLHQGAEAFRIWTGLEPNVELMRQTLNNLI